MDEYIKRDEAKAAIKKRLGTMDLFESRFNADIDSIPAADVVEVKHGRWEFDGSDFADIWKCTACGVDWFFEYDPRSAETRVNYCPECGARMDGE